MAKSSFARILSYLHPSLNFGKMVRFLEQISSLAIDDAKALLRERFLKNQALFKQKDKRLYGYLLQKPTLFGIVADKNGINIINIPTNELVYPMSEDGRHTAIEACVQMAQNPFSHTKWQMGFEINPFYMIEAQQKFTAHYCREIFATAHKCGINPNNFYFPKQRLTFAALYGLGGGIVLEAMLEHYTQIDSLLIYEPYPDFFAISAYFVDYEELFTRVKSVLFSIAHKPSALTIREFFVANRFGALYPRAELTMYATPDIGEVKNSVRVEAGSLFRGFGTYEDEMIGWQNSQKNSSFRGVNYPVLCKPPKSSKRADFPICVVGSGASLDENIDFLAKNQRKMIIFSCGTALKTLLKKGITPDFQIEIERTDYLADILKEAGGEGVEIIAANVVDPKTLKVSGKNSYIFFRDYTASSYLDKPKFLLRDASPFVGNAAFSLALTFSKNIILCGIDVGYKRGKTIHSKDSIYAEDTALPPDSIRVKANFEESEIYSNPMYGLSRASIEMAISRQSGAKILNISDGAFIKGAIPSKEPLLKDGDKDKMLAFIKTSFSSIPKDIFERDGLLYLDSELEAFRQELFCFFGGDLREKGEFFDMIRAFEEYLIRKEIEAVLPFFLFGGSIRHITFALYLSVLHTDNVEFRSFWEVLKSIFFESFDAMVADFKSEIAKGRVSSLLSGVKSL